MAQMNQNALLAWMTAVGGAAAQQNAFASAPAPPRGTRGGVQQLARLQRSAAADAGDDAAPAGGGSAHQPL